MSGHTHLANKCGHGYRCSEETADYAKCVEIIRDYCAAPFCRSFEAGFPLMDKQAAEVEALREKLRGIYIHSYGGLTDYERQCFQSAISSMTSAACYMQGKGHSPRKAKP